MATSLPIQSNASNVNIVFPNKSFSKIILSSSISDMSGTSLNSLSLFAQSLSDISIDRSEPTTFNSIQELQGIEYVGYIIDKERLNRNTSEWVRIDEYRIIGADADSFIDTRVAFGECYRYRISSILRFTQQIVTTSSIVNTAIHNLPMNNQKNILEAINNNQQIFNSSSLFTSHGISNKNVPKNNYIFNLDKNTYAKITNDQIQIFQSGTNIAPSGRSSKNIKITDPKILTDNANVRSPQNGKLTTTTVTYQSSYYQSLVSKNWTYVDVVENVLPNAPQGVKIVPNTLKNTITLYWLAPEDDQRDIKSYRIYRREKIGDPWNRIAEINDIDIGNLGTPDFNVIKNNIANLFVDKNVNVNKSYIYAMTSYTVHGIESFLSTQIGCQLNPKFKLEMQEKPLTFVSGEGAALNELNFVYKKFTTVDEQLIAKNSVTITPNTHFKDVSKDFLLRFTSLDNHAKLEYVLTIQNNKII
jgi:hypothetical protein